MFKTNETSANGLGPKALEKPIQDVEAEMPPSMPAKPHPGNYTWSERMKRVFLVVVEVETAVGDTPEFFGWYPVDGWAREFSSRRRTFRIGAPA
jgi:hypothetical protein